MYPAVSLVCGVGVYALILPRQYLAAGDLSPFDRIYETYHYILPDWLTFFFFSNKIHIHFCRGCCRRRFGE